MIADRFEAALASVVRAVFPRADYQAFYPYTVFSFDEAAQTADVQPATANAKVPALKSVPVRAPGLKVKLVAGASVLVGFEGADPSRPFVAFHDYQAIYATALPAARQGDLVQTNINLVPVPPATSGPPWLVTFLGVATPPAGPTAIGSIYGVISTGSVLTKTQ